MQLYLEKMQNIEVNVTVMFVSSMKKFPLLLFSHICSAHF